LIAQAPAGVNLDFHLLERAYRGMQAENFATFIEIFKAEGHDLSAKNANGKTLSDLVGEHSAFTEYAEILARAGAN